jgi:hypothetical protein
VTADPDAGARNARARLPISACGAPRIRACRTAKRTTTTPTGGAQLAIARFTSKYALNCVKTSIG